jgi:hypothetical protein
MKEPNFYSIYNIFIKNNGIVLSYRFFEFVLSFSPQAIEIKNFETHGGFITGNIIGKPSTFNKNNFLELLEKIIKEVQKYETHNS